MPAVEVKGEVDDDFGDLDAPSGLESDGSDDDGDDDDDDDDDDDGLEEKDESLEVLSDGLEWKEIKLEEKKLDHQPLITDHANYYFDERRTGVRNGIVAETALDAFLECFPKEIIRDLCVETGRYASQQGNVISPLTHIDMSRFLAILLYMGVVRRPTIKHYWSKSSFGDHTIPKIMTRDRFLEIFKYFHCCNNEADDDPNDFWWKVRGLVNRLNIVWAANFTPGPFLSVDEDMIKSRQRHRCVSYIKSKRARFGFKVFLSVDPDDVYIQSIHLPARNSSVASEITGPGGYSGHQVRQSLALVCYPRQRCVVVDQGFSSIHLGLTCCEPAIILLEHSMTIAGLVLQERTIVSSKFVVTCKFLKQKQPIAIFTTLDIWIVKMFNFCLL